MVIYLSLKKKNSYEIKIDNTANNTGSTEKKEVIRACICGWMS